MRAGGGVTLSTCPRSKTALVDAGLTRIEQPNLGASREQSEARRLGQAQRHTTGAPCQLVPAGSFSPRSTTERPPTRVPAPITVSGSTTLYGPSVEPRREGGGADPHQAVVEEVRLDARRAVDDASVAEFDNVELGDVQRFEPHVLRRPWRPSPAGTPP